MTPEQFWQIIDEVHAASGGDMARKCELLAAPLRRLPLEELRAYDDHFSSLKDRAYSVQF
jgi:hypothetical protein